MQKKYEKILKIILMGYYFIRFKSCIQYNLNIQSNEINVNRNKRTEHSYLFIQLKIFLFFHIFVYATIHRERIEKEWMLLNLSDAHNNVRFIFMLMPSYEKGT